jgi:endonuclease-8
VCFLSGITPWTRVGDVPDLGAVVDRAARLLVANKDRVRQVTTGDTRRGYQNWVFERSGRPCLRCGTTVRSAEQGDPPRARITYWCPTCQRGPAPADAKNARPHPR